jgi:RNA polymerase sigma factor (sigma-70 family)
MEKAQIAQLVTKAQSGDKTAFEALYRLTNQQAFFVARKLARMEEDALDILQDSYVKALGGLSKLENPESFCGWFNRIVANTGKDYLVKSGFVLFDNEEDEDAALNSLADEDGDFMPEESLDTSERREIVMDIIDGLPEDKRLCVLLYYYDGMSAPDIARALDVSEGTVKSRLHDARGKIKSSIEKLERQGVKLFGAAPLSCFRWILERCTPYAELSAENSEKVLDVLKGSAVLAGGAILAGSAAAGASAAGASGTAAVAGGIAGTVAKIAAVVTVPKLIATAAAAAVVVGGTVGGAEVIKHNIDKNKTEAVAAAVTTIPTTDELLTGLLAEESATFAGDTEPEIAIGEVHIITTGRNTDASGTSSANIATTKATTAGTTKSASIGATKTTAAASTAKATTKPTTATTKAGTTTKPTTTTTTKPATTTTTKPATTTTTTTNPATTTTTTAPSTDFTYSVSGGSATVSGYTGGATSVSIPSTLGGATVGAIGSYAFEDSGIHSVSMPSSLKTIGNGAFGNCTSLSGVSFSGGLRSIGIGAFQNCPSLTTLTLPSGLESIGASGFEGCSGLTNITIPSSVTSIGSGAFDGCPNLTIRCANGSSAHSYAVANGIDYVLI